jgi:AcrR family transcriptional regulator
MQHQPVPATAGPAAAARRTQAERSATTRAALADAAIDVLTEHGWAAVTAIEVCNRAGVTRGAFHHHYDALPALLADALRRLYADMAQPSRPPPADLPGLLDVTWAAIGSPRFKAVIEAWLAMANDPALREQIGPVVAQFSALVSPGTMPAILTSPRHRDFYLLARETMLGLALGRATGRGRPLRHERAVLAQLSAAAAELDDRG